MTIPDITPPSRGRLGASSLSWLRGSMSSLDFSIGPDSGPAQAMNQVTETIGSMLPTIIDDRPDVEEICRRVQGVAAELVDVTARHRASVDLIGRVTYDGRHVTVSVGEIDRPLPSPAEEPGLYLVHRVAEEVGQHAGDFGGRVTWAAIPVRP